MNAEWSNITRLLTNVVILRLRRNSVKRCLTNCNFNKCSTWTSLCLWVETWSLSDGRVRFIQSCWSGDSGRWSDSSLLKTCSVLYFAWSLLCQSSCSGDIHQYSSWFTDFYLLKQKIKRFEQPLQWNLRCKGRVWDIVILLRLLSWLLMAC